MKRLLISLIAVALVAPAIPGVAIADPIDDKRAEAEQARAQVAEVDGQLEIAIEDYNEADEAYRAVTDTVDDMNVRLEGIRARIATFETSLGDRADYMYRNGPLGMLEVLLNATSFRDFATLWDTLMTLSQSDAGDLSSLKAARAEAETLEVELIAAQAEAEKQRDLMAERKAGIESKLAERELVLTGLEAEVAQLEAAAAAAAEARARSAASTSRGDSGNPSRVANSAVVDIAMRYLGVPYRWAASGPDAFDCSGFTMYVYAQVGVLLPHSSRGQYSCGERVSRANLQAGDLVFFGTSRIHHVGIYIGGGQFIHAPQTGDVVKISSLAARSNYAGACRP